MRACCSGALAKGHDAPRHYISSLFAGLLSQEALFFWTQERARQGAESVKESLPALPRQAEPVASVLGGNVGGVLRCGINVAAARLCCRFLPTAVLGMASWGRKVHSGVCCDLWNCCGCRCDQARLVDALMASNPHVGDGFMTV